MGQLFRSFRKAPITYQVYSRLVRSAIAVPPTMGVPTASSGEAKTACGRAKDHGIVYVNVNVAVSLFAKRTVILNARQDERP